MPPVSVVIVTFNSSAEITRCLEALRASDLDIELIVIDNHSEDKTAELVERLLGAYPNAQFKQMPQNLGFARAVNEGQRLATGEYTVILNPDCYVTPATLREMVKVMDGDATIGMAGCLLVNEDGSEQSGCRRYVPTPWRSLMRVLQLDRIPVLRTMRMFGSFVMSQEPMPSTPVEVEALSGALMMVRRKSLASVGLLDETYFMHCEDLDWCMRFRDSGWRVVFVPNARATHVKGCSSRSRPVRVEYYKHAGMVRFYRQHFSHRYPKLLMLAVFLSIWARFLVKTVVLLPESFRAFRRNQTMRSDQLTERLGVEQR
ncbi:MAG TPA: glycosyltransferase family 2 protein [Burkholderiales bacterium]|nr:glycosyltransferase family 2 protein [Burkholderiales bacterium]